MVGSAVVPLVNRPARRVRAVKEKREKDRMAGKLDKTGQSAVVAPKSPAGQATYVPDSTVGYIVRDVHRAFSRSLQARIATHGVSMGQWFFLRALWEEDGLTQRELSQRVGMMEPTTVTALNSMERRGLVERVRNIHDRRKVNIYLTPKGRGLRDVLLPCAAEVNNHAIRGVSKADLMMTMEVLRQMEINLGDAGGEAEE